MHNLKLGFLLSIYKNDSVTVVDECLNSIYLQSKKSDEVIIVIEGKIDDEMEKLLNSYQKKIKNFIQAKMDNVPGPLNYGLPACLNYGISISSSDYILRIDSDDINHLERVEKTYNFLLKNSDVKLGSSNIIEYDETMRKKKKKRAVPELNKDIIRFSKFRNPFNGPAVFFNRKIAIQLGGYPLVASNEDYCFWVSFIKYGYKCYNFQENLVKMRAGSGIIKRRSSTRYMLGEWQSLRYLYGISHFTFFQFIAHFFTRTLIRLLPTKNISFIYNKFLRK